jgi:hypothetical protein
VLIQGAEAGGIGAAAVRTLGELLTALPDPEAELEAELELQRQLAREAYELGQADGWRRGYARAEADMARRWQEISALIAIGGVTHEELELRRWGPGGREHFGDPRPGDRVSESRRMITSGLGTA